MLIDAKQAQTRLMVRLMFWALLAASMSQHSIAAPKPQRGIKVHVIEIPCTREAPTPNYPMRVSLPAPVLQATESNRQTSPPETQSMPPTTQPQKQPAASTATEPISYSYP